VPTTIISAEFQVYPNHKAFDGNQFMPTTWKNGMLEKWNIGDKS
jgi:hypothetical protein